MKTVARFMQWSGPVVSIGYMTAAMFVGVHDKEFLMHCVVGCIAGHVVVFLGNILFALGENRESKPRDINELPWENFTL
jgi:hypothetical protein